MFSVAAWHGDLVRRGVPARYNGVAVVICLGGLLGGPALALAHVVWARACEARSLERADFHFRRAEQIIADFPDQAQILRVSDLRRSFRERHGLPREDKPSTEGFDDDLMSLPWREGQAYTLRETGRLREALTLLDDTITLTTRVGDAEREMRLRILRGLVYEDLGEYELGASDYEAAAGLADAIGDDGRRFEARNNAAASLLKQDLPQHGVGAFMRIMRQIDSSGSLGQRVAARNNLGLALQQAGSLERSLEVYKEAVGLAEDHDAMPSSITLAGMAATYERLGMNDEARHLNELRLRDWFEHRDMGALVAYLTSSTTDLTADDTREMAESVLQYLLDEDDQMFAFGLAYNLARLSCRQNSA